MKVLHTSDIHLREYGDKRWESLQVLVELGRKEKIDVLVICGDLFDKEVNADILRPKIREIFSGNPFKIVIIPGNHDSGSYKSGLYFGEDVVILTHLNKPFEYKDVVIWGMPFEPMEGADLLQKFRSLSNNLRPTNRNILLFHGELLDAVFSRGDFGEEGERRDMSVKLSYFKDLKVDYVLAGHFHTRFNVWKLENGGYFVYSGSPVSITRRETGRRRVNIFEVGDSPHSYYVDTFHFEEVVIELDPFIEDEPLEMVRERMQRLHPEAKAILRIKGYINSKKIKMSEAELTKKIKEIAQGSVVEQCDIEFKDIHEIIEDDLFQHFIRKLEETDYDEERKKKLRELAIGGMIKAKRWK